MKNLRLWIKEKLDGWQFVWQFSKGFDRLESGWRLASVGIFKVIPEKRKEGAHLKRGDYHGFLLHWRYWLPWEKY